MTTASIFLLLLAAACCTQALECNHCECIGKGKRCTSNVVTCDPEHPHCIIVYYDHQPSTQFVQNCAQHLECEIIAKTGNETRIQYECCNTDRCN